MRVKDIKKIDPLAECYHLPGKNAGGFLLIVFPLSAQVPEEGIAEKDDDVLDGRIIFADEPKLEIYHYSCPICNAFLECRVPPDAKES